MTDYARPDAGSGGFRAGHAAVAGALMLALLLGLITMMIGPELLPTGSIARHPPELANGPGRAASDVEQVELMRLVLLGPVPVMNNRLAARTVSFEEAVLLSTNIVLCQEGADQFAHDCGPHGSEMLSSPGVAGALFEPLVQTLVEANRRQSTHPALALPDLLRADGDTIAAAWRAADDWRLGPPFEGRHMELRLSRAVISNDGRHAVILYAFRCGETCGQATLMRYVREGGAWRIDATHRLWIS